MYAELYNRLYRSSMLQKEKVRLIIDDLLKKNNIIRESESPYTSPVILVKKIWW